MRHHARLLIGIIRLDSLSIKHSRYVSHKSSPYRFELDFMKFCYIAPNLRLALMDLGFALALPHVVSSVAAGTL